MMIRTRIQDIEISQKKEWPVNKGISAEETILLPAERGHGKGR